MARAREEPARPRQHERGVERCRAQGRGETEQCGCVTGRRSLCRGRKCCVCTGRSNGLRQGNPSASCARGRDRAAPRRAFTTYSRVLPTYVGGIARVGFTSLSHYKSGAPRPGPWERSRAPFLKGRGIHAVLQRASGDVDPLLLFCSRDLRVVLHICARRIDQCG